MKTDYTKQQKLLISELEKTFANGNFKSTVVDMQKNYADDDQICLTSVVFIPTEISQIITEKIIKPLQTIDPEHYYFPPESMHLTIKNVRTISKPPLFTESDVIKTKELFSKTIPRFPSFDFQVEDILLFPTSISVMAYSGPVLQDLVQALDKGLKEIGVPDNKKYISNSVFWGNITVCRFTHKPNEEFIRVVKNLRNLKIGSFKAGKVNLLTSNVVLQPNTKRIIAEYDLKKMNLH